MTLGSSQPDHKAGHHPWPKAFKVIDGHVRPMIDRKDDLESYVPYPSTEAPEHEPDSAIGEALDAVKAANAIHEMGGRTSGGGGSGFDDSPDSEQSGASEAEKRWEHALKPRVLCLIKEHLERPDSRQPEAGPPSHKARASGRGTHASPALAS